MAEARDGSQDEEGASQLQDDGKRGHLTPLQKSLLFEITSRRDRFASAQLQVDFWEKRQSARPEDRFNADVLDDKELDELIAERRAELTRLKETRQLERTIMDAADAAHAINASMAAHPPPSHASGQQDLPLSRRPLRYLADERDILALEHLQIDADIKEVRRQRSEMVPKLDTVRRQTASLIEQVRSRAEAIQQVQRDELQSTARRDEKSRALNEALREARGKREMVKGVLRGLILESGLDWCSNQELRKLMLELGGDDLDASDDEPDFESDSEG